MDWTLFTGFCVVIFSIFLYKSISVYKIYHSTFYEELYSNFFEFYIKFKYKKNLSQSSWLKQEIGTHRILFNSYLNEDQKLQFQFVTVFSRYGVTILSINTIYGIIQGSPSDAYWKNDKQTTTTRFLNPTLACASHKEYISDLIGNNMEIDTFILFPNDTSIQKVKSKHTISSFNNFIHLIKLNDRNYSSETILNEFKKCIGR